MISINYKCLFLFVLIPLMGISQTTYTISDGNATGIDIPIDNYYNYSYSQQIFLNSEINVSGDIMTIQFEYNGYQAFTDNIDIYMGHTSKSSFSSTSDWVSASAMTLVYSGNISVTTSAGWVTISLNTPFNYNNTDNLVIAVDENTASYHASQAYFYALGTGINTSRSIVYSNDYINPNPSSPPSGYVQNYVPSLKLGISTGPSINASVSQLTDLVYCLGNGPSATQSFSLTGSSLTNDISLNCSSDFEISLDGSTYSSSLTLSKDAFGSASSTVYARLKSGLQQGAYNSQINITSTGATQQDVSLDGAAAATTIYVSSSGNDVSGSGTSSNPFASLAVALSASQSNSCGATTIHVGAGVYSDNNLVISSSDLTIIGDSYSSTIFDGVNYQNRFATITGSNVSLKNIKVKKYGLPYSNCNISGTCGGGAMVIGDGSASLANINLEKVIFNDNYNDGSSGDGGALHIQYNCNVVIDQCVFSQNYAGNPSTTSSNTYNNGGAVYVEGEVIFNNCEFYRNISKGYGSAVYVDGSLAEATFYHSTISNNNARGNYGALTVSGGFISFYNSIAYGNLFSASSLGYDFYESSGLLTASYSLYRDDYFSRSSVSNCLTADPLFTDESNNDYSLQSTSPAIDAGLGNYSLADDITGLSRPQGSGYDMGAYEYSLCNSPSVTYNVLENCSANTFTVEATVTSYGDGTSADINDGTTTVSNASLNTVYTFGPYSTSSTITLNFLGASYGGCDGNSNLLSACVPNVCVDAIDLSAGNIVADFSVAANDDSETDFGGEPNYLQVGNGTTIASCAWGTVHNAYDYTEYKDLWFKVVVPAGDDEFTLTFSNVNGNYVVVPYFGTCGSLTQMTLLYNSNQSITGVIDNDGNNWYGDDPYVTPSITTLDFKGAEILNAPGGIVYLRIFPYDGGQGGSAGCIASNFSTASLTINSSISAPSTRTTVQNGNWEDASTWDCNCAPIPTDNFVVNHTITQYADFAIGANNSLTINSGAQLNIQPSHVMNIDGTIDNNGIITGRVYVAGTTSRTINLGTLDEVAITTSATVTLSADAFIKEKLTLAGGTLDASSFLVNLESDLTTTALIEDNGGTFVGNINMKRFIQNNLGHHFLSSPVSNATVNQLNDDITLDLVSAPFPNIYYYDETNPSLDYTEGWEAPSSLSHSMAKAQGYSLYFNASNGITIDIQGTPTTGAVSRALSYTAGPSPPTGATAPQGWNFVGNPYPSPLDFDLLMTNASASIENGCYTWDPVSSAYYSYIAGVSSPASFDNNIHSMQGFWVRSTASVNLDFDNSMRLTNPSLSSSFLKSNSFNGPIVRLSLIGQTSVCETVVCFRDMASPNFDNKYDARYLKSQQNGRVEFASIINDGLLRINSLEDDLSKNLSVPLMNKVSIDTTYSIKITEFENFNSGVDLFLEDKVLNVFHNLNESYIFNANINDRTDRFELHIVVDGYTINTHKIEDEETVEIFKCEHALCLEFGSPTIEDLNLLIYDKTGKLIYRKNLAAMNKSFSLKDLYLLDNDIYFVNLPERGFSKKIKW